MLFRLFKDDSTVCVSLEYCKTGVYEYSGMVYVGIGRVFCHLSLVVIYGLLVLVRAVAVFDITQCG